MGGSIEQWGEIVGGLAEGAAIFSYARRLRAEGAGRIPTFLIGQGSAISIAITGFAIDGLRGALVGAILGEITTFTVAANSPEAERKELGWAEEVAS